MTQICHELHHIFSTLPKFKFPFDPENIPRNGIYILFEKGELAHQADRIVRVGTHRGNNKLPSRLKEHFINENKDRSIFRKNIGRALLNKHEDPFLKQWEIDLTTKAAKNKHADTIDYPRLKEIEIQVTDYIQNNFYFTVIRVDDEKQRLFWESRLISTVSLCEACHPSNKWLGLHSPKDKIRQSGLWLVNELYKQPLSDAEYEELSVIIFGTE